MRNMIPVLNIRMITATHYDPQRRYETLQHRHNRWFEGPSENRLKRDVELV